MKTATRRQAAILICARRLVSTQDVMTDDQLGTHIAEIETEYMREVGAVGVWLQVAITKAERTNVSWRLFLNAIRRKRNQLFQNGLTVAELEA